MPDSRNSIKEGNCPHQRNKDGVRFRGPIMRNMISDVQGRNNVPSVNAEASGRSVFRLFPVLFLLAVWLGGCATVPFTPDRYTTAKVAIIYNNLHTVEYSDFDVFFRSKELSEKTGGVTETLLESDEEIFEYFRELAVNLFGKANITNFRFKKDDIFYYRHFPRLNTKTKTLFKVERKDYSQLREMGYTHVLTIGYTYNIEKKILQVGTLVHVLTTEDVINYRSSSSENVESVFSFVIGKSRICPAIHFADDDDSDYYNAQQIMAGKPNMYTRAVKASMHYFLSNTIKTMQTGKRMSLKDRSRRFYLKELFALEKNK